MPNWPIDFIDHILCGDCLDLMRFIPDKSIDMILADLPFGVTQNHWDSVIPFDPLWIAYKRIIKDHGAIVLMAVNPFAAQLIGSNLDMFRYDLVWCKNKSTGFLNAKKMPMRKHELILVFYKKLPIYNPQKTQGHEPAHAYTKHTSDGTNYGETKIGWKGGGQTDRYPTSLIQIPVMNNDHPDKKHSVQKPIALFESLVRTYTNVGMLVLDNVIGLGTTALAATNTGRHFIGMDKDPLFCDEARDRIERHKRK